MAERGRTAGFQMGHEHRQKILNSNILNRLIAHAAAEPDAKELSATQVQAGIALLKKVLPDLQATTIEGGETPVALTFGWIK